MADQTTTTPSRISDYVGSALRRDGVKIADLNEDQRDRALRAEQAKGGLRGKTLVTWIMEGRELNSQLTEARVQNDIAGSKGKSSAKKPSSGGSKKYPEPIRQAVKDAKKVKGTEHGAPGPKQHVHVRAVIAREVKGSADAADSVTKAEVVKASGAKSLAALRRLASGEADRSELKVLHPLADKMGDDAFCKGRNLAAILTAWAEATK